MNHDLPSLWKSETVWAWNHWITSLVARSGSEMTCYWIAASEQWTIPNAEYSFFDIHSLEWSNLHLSNWFRWKDYASMRLHCFHSLVAERTRQLSLSTRPAFHSFDTLITPTHHSVERSWSIRYSTQQGVFRVDRSIPDVLKWTEYSCFSSLPPKPLLPLTQPYFHPSRIYS